MSKDFVKVVVERALVYEGIGRYSTTFYTPRELIRDGELFFFDRITKPFFSCRKIFFLWKKKFCLTARVKKLCQEKKFLQQETNCFFTTSKKNSWY